MTPETEQDKRRFGRNVAELRQQAGLKQADLAARMVELGCANWRQTTVSRVEHGDQRVTLQELVALEEILGGEITRGTAGGEAVSQALQKSADASRQFDQDQIRAALQEIADARESLDSAELRLRVIARDEDAIDEFFADQGADDGKHPEEA